MYYFIPAWYGQTDEFWKTSIDPWYLTRQKLNLMIVYTKSVFFRMRS
ncbi:Accessory secretory protein Asp1 [Streptococcus sp. HSISS2]|nr:Accessory secretory protein Asp1 [Streptococcus sp. HSISS2]